MKIDLSNVPLSSATDSDVEYFGVDDSDGYHGNQHVEEGWYRGDTYGTAVLVQIWMVNIWMVQIWTILLGKRNTRKEGRIYLDNSGYDHLFESKDLYFNLILISWIWNPSRRTSNTKSSDGIVIVRIIPKKGEYLRDGGDQPDHETERFSFIFCYYLDGMSRVIKQELNINTHLYNSSNYSRYRP